MRRIGLCALLAVSACSLHRMNGNAIGSVQAAIASVPPSIHCLRIRAAGSTVVNNDFAVTPGQSALLTLNELPVGPVALRAFAYATSCGGQPTWASATSTVTIEAGTVTPVALTLEPVGGADVDVGFGSDGGAPADDMAVQDMAPDLSVRDMAPDLSVGPDLANSCAAVENCFNDLDDDCNGKVNDTCPVGLVTGPRRALTTRGGTGGTLSTIACPPDSYVVSISIWGSSASGVIAGLGITCATPSLVHTPDRYAIVNTPLSPAPFAKVMGTIQPTTYFGTEPQSNCTAGTSAASWVNSYSEPKIGASQVMVALNAQCGLILLDQVGNNRLNISTTAFGAADRFAVNFKSTSSALFGQDLCAPSGVLVGFDLRAGTAIDSVTPLCAPLVPVYRP